MARNSRDRILDACLSELIGGEKPPDLSDRILGNLNSRRPKSSRGSGGGILVLAVALSVFLVVLGALMLKFSKPGDDGGDDGGDVADKSAKTPRAKQIDPEEGSGKGINPKDAPDGSSPGTKQKPNSGKTGGQDSALVKHDPNLPGGKTPSGKNVGPDNGDPERATNPHGPVAVASSDEDIIEAVDKLIRRRWQAEDAIPSEQASDATWCRRVFLDVIGRIPTYEETLAFVDDSSPHKKKTLVDQLMGSERYIEEFARNWSNIWTRRLIGRYANARGGAVYREGFQQFVRRAFLTNKPYDQFVRELLTATGSNKPDDKDYNGAVSFLLDNVQDKAVAATSKTARIFLGLQVQCTQCHNHPFNDWKQNQFWELNAFFRQTKPQRNGRGRDAGMRLVDVTFRGEGNGDAKEAEIYFEQRNKLLKVAYPVFVDGTKINPSGIIEDVNRRQELARLIVNSKLFSRAAVNRTWAHFLGYGFTKPVDDMGPHNSPSHPEVLDLLARSFVANGHDMRQLFRWIVLSQAYSLSSKATADTPDRPQTGESPLFSRFYLRQMRAEELYESMLVATNSHGSEEATSYAEQERRKTRWLQQFTMAYDTEENDESTTFNGTISQTLMMWNGDLMARAISGDRGTFLQEIAAGDDKPAKKINRLFMSALGRRPTKSELEMSHRLWRSRQGDTLSSLRDIWWVLLNSGEFILNH